MILQLKFFPPNTFEFKYDNCIQVGNATKKELRKLANSILRQINEKKQDTAAEFGRKIGKVMMDIKSSHVFFIVQQAYGEISWEEVEEILEDVKNTKPKTAINNNTK